MPIYVIDTDDEVLFLSGEESVAFGSADEARKVALSTLAEMAQGKLRYNGDKRTFSASVRNEAGIIVYHATLTLAGAWLSEPAR